MEKKLYFLLSTVLLMSCHNQQSSPSSSSSNVPAEITFDQYSYEPIPNYIYEEVGVCPDKIISTYVPSYTEQSFTLNYDGINMVRFENSIIIYNYGSATNCNAWGYEVAVNKDGYVVEIQSLVSSIPSGGFVISGHGTQNINFFRTNFKIGQKVRYENGVIYVTDNFYERRNFEMQIFQESYIFSYQNSFKKLENIDYSAKDDIDTLCNCSFKASKALEDYQTTSSDDSLKSFVNYSSYFTNIASTIEKKLFPSRVVEARGVWYRPNERSLSEIKDFLNLMKKASINIIYLETDDGSGLTYTDPKYHLSNVLNNTYTGYKDYLTAFISEAHKLGMEVHAWDKVFHVLKEIYDDYPNGQMLYYNKGNYTLDMEGSGLLFIDPGVEEIKQFVVNKIDYLLKQYDFDGYQFDYIRYPSGNENIATSSGYSQEAIEKFGQTPSAANYQEWSEFRQEQVTETVRRATELIRKKYPRVKTSIAVVSDAESAKLQHLQDWQTWIENGYIDIVELMAYHLDVSYIKKDTATLKSFSKNRTFNYTGIAPTYMSLPDIQNSYQVQAANEGGAHGAVIFAGHNIVYNPSVATILSQSVYRLPNVLPHSDLKMVLKAAFSEIIYKYETIYIPNYAATSANLLDLKDQFIDILSKTMNTKPEMQAIQSLLRNIKANNYGNNVVSERLQEDLSYLLEIIDIHIAQKK